MAQFIGALATGQQHGTVDHKSKMAYNNPPMGYRKTSDNPESTSVQFDARKSRRAIQPPTKSPFSPMQNSPETANFGERANSRQVNLVSNQKTKKLNQIPSSNDSPTKPFSSHLPAPKARAQLTNTSTIAYSNAQFDANGTYYKQKALRTQLPQMIDRNYPIVRVDRNLHISHKQSDRQKENLSRANADRVSSSLKTHVRDDPPTKSNKAVKKTQENMSQQQPVSNDELSKGVSNSHYGIPSIDSRHNRSPMVVPQTPVNKISVTNAPKLINAGVNNRRYGSRKEINRAQDQRDHMSSSTTTGSSNSIVAHAKSSSTPFLPRL